MKSINYSFFVLILILFGFSAFAEKLVIRGEPTVLPLIGGVYHVPDAYETSTLYNYVTIDNSKKLCYHEPQPDLRALNKMLIYVNIRGIQVQWFCYNYDENYFELIP